MKKIIITQLLYNIKKVPSIYFSLPYEKKNKRKEKKLKYWVLLSSQTQRYWVIMAVEPNDPASFFD